VLDHAAQRWFIDMLIAIDGSHDGWDYPADEGGVHKVGIAKSEVFGNSTNQTRFFRLKLPIG